MQQRKRARGQAEVEGAGAHAPPVAFQCSCDFEYDCTKRAPMKSACSCERLLCRKCAGVAASLPEAAPCGLCKAEAVGPFELKDFERDTGVVAALMSMEDKATTSCAECADAAHESTARYLCTDSACELKPLCIPHAMAHQQWGHGMVLCRLDAVGVTHCAKAEHAGAAGLLTHVCDTCSVVLCGMCLDWHIDKHHDVSTMAKAAVASERCLEDAQPVLVLGLEYLTGTWDELAAAEKQLHANRDSTIADATACAVRLHEQVDAQLAEVLRIVEKLYEEKRAEVATLTKSMRSMIGQVHTASKLCDIALSARGEHVLLLHAADTVRRTLRLANERKGLSVDTTLSFEKGLDLAVECRGQVHGTDPAARESSLMSPPMKSETLQKALGDSLSACTVMDILVKFAGDFSKGGVELMKATKSERAAHARNLSGGLFALPWVICTVELCRHSEPFASKAVSFLWDMSFALAYVEDEAAKDQLVEVVPGVLSMMQLHPMEKVLESCVGFFTNMAIFKLPKFLPQRAHVAAAVQQVLEKQKHLTPKLIASLESLLSRMQ